jgi:CelD/BcsL family acetyltransferase involved in cellulose biosynthesis
MLQQAWVGEAGGLGTTVEERLGLEAVSELSAEWDALARATPESGPFALSGWTRLWVESFAPGSPLRVFCARRGGRAVGFAPLIERHGRLGGVPIRLWQSPSNEHSQRVDWALEEQPEATVRRLWEHLREKPWEVLLLKDVVAGAALDATLGGAAEADGFLVTRRTSLESPWLPVPAAGELGKVLDGKFRANLRRRRKKLAEHGALALQRVDGEEGLTGALEAGLMLEGSGWKGQEGTAILCQAETRAFYTRLARLAASEGWLALYSLSLSNRPVAFHYGLEYGGRYYLLKPGYDECFSACSPGQLLVESVLEDLGRRGTKVFDFLGPKMRWKLDWTQRLRPHVWLYIFRPSLKGRMLQAARFRYGPQALRWVRRVTAWKR